MNPLWRKRASLSEEFLAVYYQVLSGPDFKRKWQCRQKVGVSKTSNQNLSFYPYNEYIVLLLPSVKTRPKPLGISLTVDSAVLNFFSRGFKRKWQCRQKVGMSKTSNQNLSFYPAVNTITSKTSRGKKTEAVLGHV